MNTCPSFDEGSLEKELEFARARVALLESRLRSVSGTGHLNTAGCWSQVDHFKRLVDDIDQGVLVLDQEYETVFINKNALQLFESDRLSFDLLKIFSSLTAEDQQNILNLVQSQQQSGHVELHEFSLRLPSGRSVDLRLKFTPLFRVDNGYDGVQVIITDITDDLRVRQALERSEKMYQALFDGAGDAIFVHEDGGTFVDANRVACERLGYSREELLSMTPYDLRVDKVITCMDAKPDESGAGAVKSIVHKTRTGEEIFVEVNSRKVYLNGDEKILTIARDISERVEADRRAVLNRQRLKALYEMSHMNESSARTFFEFAIRNSLELSESESGFIVQLEGHGSETWFRNWVSTSLFGGKKPVPQPSSLTECGVWNECIVQRTPVCCNQVGPDDNLHPFSAGSVKSYLALPVLEAGRVVAVAVLVNRKGGYEDDNVRNLRLLLEGMWNVICKKKSEEQVRKSLREKETLLKEVHHRVKNNMQVICSLLNLQTEYINDPQDLTLIRHSIDRVRSMAYVHEQLYRSDDLSCIDFGQYISSLGLRLVSSYGVADRIRFATRLETIKLPIEQALPCGLIVNELLTNAITHAFPPGQKWETQKVSVELSFSGGTVYMSVADNGIGYDGRERPGSLGHILVDTLVQQIDGNLQSRSEGGSRFELSFKLK
ncbi:histidine kinase dimerization/phosphoacceptor domain -containing protein [Maridesulfovibrio sp. FT414]|uniref:histidine kinase dimerization/phosphoacceptor domain -containing protein n=1 Tax=Maridesulfovibrio sp. FT414 TaxID=2979469 RepID=UPI003D8035D3